MLNKSFLHDIKVLLGSGSLDWLPFTRDPIQGFTLTPSQFDPDGKSFDGGSLVFIKKSSLQRV